MSISCEVHTAEKAVAVCHHCGRPLCRVYEMKGAMKLRRGANDLSDTVLCGFQIEDPVFASPENQPGVLAVHCADCLLEHHPEYSNVLTRLRAAL